MKYYSKVAALLCVCAVVFLCTGCYGTPSVEELLRAPVLSGTYSEMQTALTTEFDSTVQLKYPTEGELLSPFSFGDWNGDGVQDAVVLFTVEDSTVVQVAILEKDAQEAWYVAAVADGLSNTVTSFEFVSLQEGDAQQIVVTFQAQGAQYLAVYSYQEGALYTMFQQPYSQYLIEDIAGHEVDDLILITSDENEVLQMSLISFDIEGYTQTLIPSFNEIPFTSYLNISVSTSAWGKQYLVVDGFVGEGQTTVVTEMLWYNTASDSFEQTALSGTSDLYNDSKRYSADLMSLDIDEDGVIEIPVQYSTQDGVLNHIQNNPITLVSWMDYTILNSEKSFGIFDDEYNYYLALPDEVMGNLLLVDGKEEGSIEVRNTAGDLLYFSLRVVDFETNDEDWYQIGTVASKQIQVKIGENASSFVMLYTLSRSIYLL